MALIRSGQTVSEFANYHYDDYEDQKKAYLTTVRDEAEALLKEARKKASDILKQAHHKGLEQANAEAQRKKSEAEEKGYQEGLKKGQQEGLDLQKKKMDEEITPLANTLKAAIKEFEHEANTLLELTESDLVEAALQLAKSVIKVESETNPEVLKARLKNGLALLKPGLEIKITIHPDQKALAQTHLKHLFTLEGVSPRVQWIEDANSPPGSVRLNAEESSVAFHSELQWEVLLEKIQGKKNNEGP